jgi:hypothetical protein
MYTKIRDAFNSATGWLDCFTEDDAGRVAQELIDRVVKTLRCDRRWVAVSRLELELLLGDVRQQIAEALIKRLEGYGPTDELLNVAAEAAAEIMMKSRTRPNRSRAPVAEQLAEHLGHPEDRA